jgi:predicted secreted acid phosphatase
MGNLLMRINLSFRNVFILVISFFHQPLFAEPTNIAVLKQNLKIYHDSGQYNHDVAVIINQAEQYIEHRAHENQQLPQPQKLALVLDIDETSLSNYNDIVKHDFTCDHKSIHQRILAANSPALLPTLSLYKEAQENGINVFFVTGRPQSECDASRVNLEKTGYHHWSALFCRPPQDHEKSIAPFKTAAREAIEKKGYIIIASIGDQMSDIKGGHAERGFKLPNPFYYLP